MNATIPTCSRPSPAARFAQGATLLLLAAHARAQGVLPEIEPGSFHEFSTTPSAVVGSCVDPFLGSCNLIEGETPLRAYAYGIVSGARAGATVMQHHEFTIPSPAASGSPPNTVLLAQIAGSVRVRGYLFTMGGATATAGVALELLDITDGADAATIVWSGGSRTTAPRRGRASPSAPPPA